MLHFLRLLRLALWRGFEHDIFTSARAAAYYSILTLFPALMVGAAVLAASHQTVAFIRQIATAVNAILPPGTPDVVRLYFENPANRPLHVLILAGGVMLFAASGVLVSLMEGFVRAYRMKHAWNPIKERLIAVLLVLLAFVPMTLATGLIAFGGQIENWMIFHTTRELGPAIILMWRGVWWLLSIVTSIVVLSLVYHLGLPRMQSWYKVLPGASLATVGWLAATEVFGWYVINYGSYNLIYGPLGAAIAMLVWLYIVALIVLVGAEFNALVHPRPATAAAQPPAQPAVQSKR